MVDHREKPRLRARPDEEKQILRQIADGTAEAGHRERRIVKTKRFGIEPMFEEDAIAEMDELGHSFFVFVNAETERVGGALPARRWRLRAHRAGHRWGVRPERAGGIAAEWSRSRQPSRLTRGGQPMSGPISGSTAG